MIGRPAVAGAALALLLGGCSSGEAGLSAPPGESVEQSSLYTAYEQSVPVPDSVEQLARRAVQLSVFRVESERYTPPPPEGQVAYITRYITVRTLSTPWVAPGRQAGAISEVVVDGDIDEGQGAGSRRNAGGAFRIGTDYLAAIQSARGRLVPIAGSVWEMDGADVLLNRQAPALAQELSAMSAEDIAAQLESAARR